MTQVYYRANLSDEQFPLVSTFQGKTIIQPSIDQNYSQSLFESKGDRGVPEALYLHNVIPSIYGYKSVAFRPAVPAYNVDVNDFKHIFSIKDFSGNRGHIAITESGKTLMFTSSAPTWEDVTPIGQPAGGVVTVADATGSSFICYSGFGIFEIDLINKALNVASISWDSPLTNADMLGIAASNNYLLAHDGSTLYWSSALDVLDFKASQITGAGSGTPTAAVGAIITINRVGIGFAVYCQGNIVVATFSGNVQYPWIFKEAPNGSGISSAYHISSTGEDNSNYAWTSAGLLKVTLAGCTAVHPEVSDFVAGRLYESYDTLTNTFTSTNLSAAMEVRIAFLSSRYLAISYGPTTLKQSLLYDVSLKRWGKLVLDHALLFDIAFDIDTDQVAPVTYSDLSATEYQNYEVTYASVGPVVSVQSAEAKHAMAVMTASGQIVICSSEFADITSDAVLLLGKYQIFRANYVGIQGFTVESLDADNTNFSVQVLTSIDGKNTYLTTDPYEEIKDNIRLYSCLATGQNHSLLLKGAFHVVAIVLVFTNEGNR